MSLFLNLLLHTLLKWYHNFEAMLTLNHSYMYIAIFIIYSFPEDQACMHSRMSSSNVQQQSLKGDVRTMVSSNCILQQKLHRPLVYSWWCKVKCKNIPQPQSLLKDRQGHWDQCADFPLLVHHSVQSRMVKFHKHFSALHIVSCSIWSHCWI